MHCIAIAPDQRHILSGSGCVLTESERTASGLPLADRDDSIIVWNVETGQQVRKLRGHNTAVQHIVVSMDGQRVVTSSKDEIRVWELETGTLIRMFEGNRSQARFSRDEQKVIDRLASNHVRVWEIETGRQLVSSELDDSISLEASLWILRTGISFQESVIATGVSGISVASFAQDLGQISVLHTRDDLYCWTGVAEGYGLRRHLYSVCLEDASEL